MSGFPISNARWHAAQELEGNDWETIANVTEEEWQELVDKFQELFHSIAQSLHLQSDDNILDVGCGPTVPARLLRTGRIIGIDPLADRLKITGETAVPGVRILNARAEEMPFPDATFDFVVCRNVIDHTQDPLAVVRETHRVLKPDKYFLLFSYVYAPFITLLKNLRERAGFLRNVEHPHTFTPAMLDALVAGLFHINQRFTVHTGQHSTDYGKTNMEPDHSLMNHAIIWFNKRVVGSEWFLKEYGFLAKKAPVGSPEVLD